MYHIHEVKKTIKEVIKEMIFIIDGKVKYYPYLDTLKVSKILKRLLFGL